MKYKYELIAIAKKYGRSLGGLLAPLMWSRLEHIRGNASVLCYHRVAPLGKNRQPSNLIVPPTVFEKHLSFLSSRFSVVSMDHILEGIERRSPVKNCIAITFDDGYADFKTFALPILRKLNLPATVYLCSDFLDERGFLWWDLLDEIVSCSKELRFSWQGKKYFFSIRGEKKNVYNQIRPLFLNSDATSQALLADRLIKASAINISSKNTAKMMTWVDIEEFKEDPIISLGGHTKSHCALSKQAKGDVRQEMTASKFALEAFLGYPVRHFAYPFGTLNEAAEREYHLAREVGFSSGVTLEKGHVNYETVDRFSIPRFHVPGGEFSVNQLKAMLSGMEMKITKLLHTSSDLQDNSGEK